MIKKFSLYVFPLLVVIFASIYLVNEPLYRQLISEDNLVEWFTFFFLFLTGIYSVLIAYRIKRRYNYFHLFFIGFALFTLLAGGEEISWGQRILHVETTGVFHKYSDQNEMNLHNTFQGLFHIKTKHIALLAMLVWGVILPWREKLGKVDFSWLRNKDSHFITPPTFLIPGFLMGAILMLDFQTGWEEEVGELFFSICFFLMLLWNYHLFNSGPKFARDGQKAADSKTRPSFKANDDIVIRGNWSSLRT